jgi:hypothetical protein
MLIVYPESPGPDLFPINDISGLQVSFLQKSTMIEKKTKPLELGMGNLARR